jgi:hypothetical protein
VEIKETFENLGIEAKRQKWRIFYKGKYVGMIVKLKKNKSLIDN